MTSDEQFDHLYSMKETNQRKLVALRSTLADIEQAIKVTEDGLAIIQHHIDALGTMPWRRT